MAAEAAAWQDCGVGGGGIAAAVTASLAAKAAAWRPMRQLGGQGGSLARVHRWRHQQRGGGTASSSAAVAAQRHRSQRQRGCGRLVEAAASLTADTAAWRKHDSAAAAARWEHRSAVVQQATKTNQRENCLCFVYDTLHAKRLLKYCPVLFISDHSIIFWL